MRLLRESCLTLCNKPDELKELANARGWLPKSNDELAKNDNDFTRLIGGWTFNDALTSYAVIQSAGRNDSKLFVCSITTKVLAGVEAAKVKVALENRYTIHPGWDIERTGSLSYRYRIVELGKMPIGVTLVITPATSILTLRCLHGNLTPSSTQAAPALPNS